MVEHIRGGFLYGVLAPYAGWIPLCCLHDQLLDLLQF